MSELPKGWESVNLIDFIHSVSTGVPKFSGERKYYSTGSINGKSHMPEGEYSFDKRPSRANRIAVAGDVFQARMQGTDKSLLTQDSMTGQLFSTGFMQFRPIAKTYESNLLFYFVKSDYFLKQRDEFATGSTQIALTDANAVNLKLIVPPLNEQRRIVAKLEKLLHRVDACKERLEKIPAILKRFRQSILATACSGRLTEDWRVKNKSDFEEWNNTKLGDIADMRLGKMLDKAKNIGEPTRYLRNLNVRWFSFEITDLAFIRVTKEEKKALSVNDGDLLVCEGGEPGRCAVWNLGKTELVFQKAIHRIRPNNNTSSQWISFNLKNDAVSGRLDDYFTGTTIKHLTGKSLAKYEIPLPPLPEQHEIVRRVNALFKKADEIEARYKKAKAFVDRLTQSILAKAFRGELVPQGTNDEPASVLLERIKVERTKQDPKRRGKRVAHDA